MSFSSLPAAGRSSRLALLSALALTLGACQDAADPTSPAAPGARRALATLADSSVLLSYAPGLAGGSVPTFSRGTSATYVTAQGLVAVAAAGVMRDAHVLADGTRVLLLEPTATNRWTYSGALGNAAWTPTLLKAVTCTGALAPDGTSTACRLTPSTKAGTHTLGRSASALLFTNNARSTVSVFARGGADYHLAVSSTGLGGAVSSAVFELTSPGRAGGVCAAVSRTAGVVTTTRALANNWCALTVTVPNGAGYVTPRFSFGVQNSATGASYRGDGVGGLELWGPQLESDQPYATSYIATAGAAVTRYNDQMSFPVTFGPQVLSVLMRVSDVAGVFRQDSPLSTLFQIGAVDGDRTELMAYVPSTGPVVTAVQSDDRPSPFGGYTAASGGTSTPGLHVDTWVQMGADGAVQADGRAPGEAGAPGPVSAPWPFQSDWQIRVLTVGGSYAQSVGRPLGLRRLLIVAGTESLDAMRLR